MRESLLLDVDSYKASHFLQYPPGAQYASSYIESRGGAYPFTLFFGLQIFLKDVLSKPITKADIEEAEEIFLAHGEPFHRAGWERILNKHGGYPPLRIQAVREGTVLPTRNVLVQIVNTDPETAWLTSYVETALLRAVWYPTTVATRSRFIKNILCAALEKSCDDPESQLSFKLHDFGARGASSRQSAAIGGAAHLVNFKGGDTIGAVLLARAYYDEPMAAFSIPAAEHSTITSWGAAGEEDAYANMLNQFGGAGKILAVVSDSYDLFHAIEHIWGEKLKPRIEALGGTLVVRPDSGDPTIIPIQAIERLAEKFGARVNNKGYCVLPNCIRVLQGDGVNERSIAMILDRLLAAGFSAENIAFGMGGALLQGLDRDTLKFAMKASAIRFADGGWRDVFKQPATDPGKASKKGRLALVRRNGAFETIREDALKPQDVNLLEDVFLNGEILRRQSFADVRAQSEAD